MGKDLYHHYLRTRSWQDKRSKRLALDDYKCQICGSPIDFQVHHITYENIYFENIEQDLITVCRKCHTYLEKEKEIFKKQASRDVLNFIFKNKRHDMINNFLDIYKTKDCVFGGTENLCKQETIEKYWKELYGIDTEVDGKYISYLSTIREYFRQAKEDFIKQKQSDGASKKDLRRIGISNRMIEKYWIK